MGSMNFESGRTFFYIKENQSKHLLLFRKQNVYNTSFQNAANDQG